MRDPRVVGRTTHELTDILFLTLCAVLCGMDDWESIEERGKEREDWLRQFVEVKNGIPSHDTISRVFAALDSVTFQACFVRWMSALCPSLEGQIVAIDGKMARGSHHRRCGKQAIHIVSAFVCGHGLTLGQLKTEEKSNEITAIPELIAALEEIENRLHWCLDVSFNEDASRIRTDHAPENMNIVKKIAMNLLRLNSLQRSLPKKRLKACLNNQYLAEVLSIST